MSVRRGMIARGRATLALSCFVPMCCFAAAPPGSVEQGADLYREHCETCHGRNMIAAGSLAFDLRKFPDDPQRFRASVMNGKGGMPSWRDMLTDEDVANLWAYVRSGAGKS